MAGPMTAYRCDVTSALAVQMVCRPTNFCLLLLSAVPYLSFYFMYLYTQPCMLNITMLPCLKVLNNQPVTYQINKFWSSVAMLPTYAEIKHDDCLLMIT